MSCERAKGVVDGRRVDAGIDAMEDFFEVLFESVLAPVGALKVVPARLDEGDMDNTPLDALTRDQSRNPSPTRSKP